MKGLILAGGKGTRLRPLTFTGNKHLLPIANKPMILYALEHLKQAGVTEIGVVVGYYKEGLIELLGDGSKYGVNITYIEQDEPRGLAHAVLVSEEYLKDEPFIMYLGDNLLNEGVQNFIKAYQKDEIDCLVGVSHVNEPSRYGVVVFDAKENAVRFVEKPRDPISNWALIGVYIFNKKVFEAAKQIKPSWRGELEITDTIQLLLESKSKIKVEKVKGWWKDTGKPDDLLQANQLVLSGLNITSSEDLNNVVIGEDTTIDERAFIRGPAIIGDHCTIGENTYIGPYTSIGDNTTILNTEIDNSIIMENCKIDCGRRIVDSIIGQGVEITNYEHNQPKGHKLIVGDMSKVTL
jgi:glucose-1-phosphate thymidylyltransferase